MKKLIFFALLLALFSYFGHPGGPPLPMVVPNQPAATAGTEALSEPASAPETEADGNDAADAAQAKPPGSMR